MRLFITFLFLFLISFHTSSHAQLRPDPLAGWTHDEKLSGDSSQKHGRFTNGSRFQFSTSVVAELDGNPDNGKELVAIDRSTTVYAFRSDGSLMWSTKVKARGCSLPSPLSSPAVGDLYGNGKFYVVLGFGGTGRSCPGGVIALRGSDGKKAWRFDTKKYSKRYKYYAIAYGVVSSPALADVDGDGRLEIGFGSYNRFVYLLNANGSVRWSYIAADTVWSSPAFVNVDSDPDLEMIIGTDITQNKFLRPPTPNGGFLYAFKTKQKQSHRIGFRDKNAYLWLRAFDQILQSSPSVGELISGNAGLEIVIGSGCYFPEGSKNKRGKWVKILSAGTGKVLRTLDAPACSASSPAIADIDEDGANEVVATINGASAIGGDGKSRLIAWEPESGKVLWSLIPRTRGGNDAYGGNYMSPVVADIDGNGSLEVLVSNNSGVAVYSGKDGSALSCEERTCDDDDLLLSTTSVLKGSPTIADLNNDGVLEVIVSGSHSGAENEGTIFVWTAFSSIMNSPVGSLISYYAPWPRFRHDEMNSGYLE